MVDQHALVAGRECGACDVCCVSLTIDDPQLQKLPGFRCGNLRRGVGCSVYETRPNTCSAFHCGWRRLKWVRDGLRPDISGVLVGIHGAPWGPEKTLKLGVMFTLLSRSALDADGLAESIAAAVSAEIPVMLSVNGPPGFTSGVVRVEEALRHPVLTRDKAAVLRVVKQAYRTMSRSRDHERIVLAPHPAVAAPSAAPSERRSPVAVLATEGDPLMSAMRDLTSGGSDLTTGTDAGTDQPLNQGQKTQNNQVRQTEQNARPGGATGDKTNSDSADTAD